MPFTDPAKHIMLDALALDTTHISLHSADPGTDGSNELAGGDPAYARQVPTFAPSANGEKALSGTNTFDVPAGATVAYIGFWQEVADPDPDIFLASAILAQPEVYGAQGTFTVDTTTKYDINDPGA